MKVEIVQESLDDNRVEIRIGRLVVAVMRDNNWWTPGDEEPPAWVAIQPGRDGYYFTDPPPKFPSSQLCAKSILDVMDIPEDEQEAIIGEYNAREVPP